jgi:anaerobic magnesium-protoporphyrin IX monomethyl ester cyclase
MNPLTRSRDPRFLLIFPPLQFRPEDSAKPDGSLALPYLAGALRAHGFEVDILDACVGTSRHSLQETFYSPRELSNGLLRIGMSPDDIAREAEHYDVVGITSIFTAQTSRVMEVVKLVKTAYPTKLVVLGGVNARYLAERFFDAGADLVCLSEAESTILELARLLRIGSLDFGELSGVAFRRDGKTVSTAPKITAALDDLAMPAWDMLPLQRYWAIARPHGGGFSDDTPLRYASLMTSRGCPFDCEFCHISKEGDGSASGNIRQLRLKSEVRVMEEIDRLKDLGVEYVFLEDDSLLAKKKRAMRIFDQIRRRRLTLSAVNGVNLVHLFRAAGGRREVDVEILQSMAAAGFREISLPFESGSQRILDTYAAGKLDLTLDLEGLIRTAKGLGMIVGGNYTFGYPDETYEEMTQTLLLAQRHMDAGMDRANLMIIVPFPGTKLYDRALQHGHLSPDFDPDLMNWMYPTMTGTVIHPEVLRYVTRLCWRMLNHSPRVTNITSMALAEVHPPLEAWGR